MKPRHLPNDWLENYSAWLQAQDKRPLTIKNYCADVRHFTKWYTHRNARPFTPADLTPTDLQLYRTALQQDGRRAATVTRHLASMRNFSAWAVKQSYLALDPSQEIRGVAQQPHAPQWLDNRAQFALMQSLERARNAAQTPT
jgi:site-specific recombinase XerD